MYVDGPFSYVKVGDLTFYKKILPAAKLLHMMPGNKSLTGSFSQSLIFPLQSISDTTRVVI
jgi:hypothetical protein